MFVLRRVEGSLQPSWGGVTSPFPMTEGCACGWHVTEEEGWGGMGTSREATFRLTPKPRVPTAKWLFARHLRHEGTPRPSTP